MWQLYLLILVNLAPVVLTSPVVKTLNGSYQGYSLPEFGQDVFLGMPYAQPPIGDLRFRAPQSLNSTWSGIKPAVTYSDVCMQYVVRESHPRKSRALHTNSILSLPLGFRCPKTA